MDWPELSLDDLHRCAAISAYRTHLDTLFADAVGLRLRIASMGRDSGRELTRYIRHLKITRIFEIGTCAGIGAAYMCSAAETNGPVSYVGMEGVDRKREIANIVLERFCPNTAVTIVPGHFDQSFAEALDLAMPLQFVYLDGYHKREPTIRMFNSCIERMPDGGVIVCDDLHWKAQGDAHKVLQRHKRVKKHIRFAKKDAFTIGAGS